MRIVIQCLTDDGHLLYQSSTDTPNDVFNGPDSKQDHWCRKVAGVAGTAFTDAQALLAGRERA